MTSPLEGSYPLSVRGIPATGYVPTWQAGGWSEWAAGGGGGGITSITGAGIGATPGDLAQAGGFTVLVNNASATGFAVEDVGSGNAISVIQTGTGGVNVLDLGAGGITLNANGAGDLVLESTNTGEVAISGTHAGNININQTGTGSINIDTIAGAIAIQCDVTHYININGNGGGSIFLGAASDKVGFLGAAPIVRPTVTGALSTVADAPAKAVLTAIIAALDATGLGLVANGTT